MLLIVLVVVIGVALLVSMDRVGCVAKTDGQSRKTADDRILSRFLHPDTLTTIGDQTSDTKLRLPRNKVRRHTIGHAENESRIPRLRPL
jgi:hypothetical protein